MGVNLDASMTSVSLVKNKNNHLRALARLYLDRGTENDVVLHNMPGTMDHPGVKHLALRQFQMRGRSKSVFFRSRNLLPMATLFIHWIRGSPSSDSNLLL
jgi:hypothetical protein